MDFNNADWIIIGVVGLSAVISVLRGLVKEAMSLAVWVVAYILSVTFDEQVAGLFTNLDIAESFKLVIAKVVIFVTVLILGSIVNYLLGKLVQSTGLSSTDRLLGLIFGVFRGLVIVLAVLMVLPIAIPVDQDVWWQSSVLIPKFLEFEGWALQTWEQLLSFFKQW